MYNVLHVACENVSSQESYSTIADQTLTLEMLREALLAVASRIQCFKEAVQVNISKLITCTALENA